MEVDIRSLARKHLLATLAGKGLKARQKVTKGAVRKKVRIASKVWKTRTEPKESTLKSALPSFEQLLVIAAEGTAFEGSAGH
jgi:hypothetical protein